MNNAKILVVEDEPISAMEIEETLSKMGHKVVKTVPSGEQAFEMALNLKPDLIIMDIHLKSFIDGIDAARRIRMISTIPIIYVTAYPNKTIQERANLTAPSAYLLKPLKEEELEASIEKALA